MPSLRIPVSTYRVQFSLGFRFVDGRDLVPYLNDLGITDLYSSPRFKARRGSSHAYDVANPLRINSELGTEAEFAELSEKLKQYSMGLVLDIVPNHMAASRENPWWMDVLENGQASLFAAYFDIDWRRTCIKSAADGKVVLPVLGDLYGNVLENQGFLLKIDESGFYLQYYDHRLPVSPKTYHHILRDCLERMQQSGGAAEFRQHLEYLIDALDRLPSTVEDQEAREDRHRTKEDLKREVWVLYRNVPEIQACLDETVRVFNGTRGDPASFDKLDRLIAVQPYRPAYWRMANEELNYRRFFDITDLVSVRIEDARVMEFRESEVLGLISTGMATGFRVDHIDGLFDPLLYLERMQDEAVKRAGEPGGSARFFIIVEKILGGREELPREWAAFGTTGYDFLGYLNGLFVEPQGLGTLGEIYRRFAGMNAAFGDVRREKKKLVMHDLFAGEVSALGNHLGRLASQDRRGRDLSFNDIVRALVEVTAWFPVYRTYIRDYQVTARDRAYIEEALEAAQRSCPDISEEVFAFLRRVLLLDIPHYLPNRWDWLHFVMRWQQFTGPVMAKGFEDTSCYVYNRLVSQNEVGSDPELADHPPGLEEFHSRNLARLADWPHSMNATSTHDTKRSEDVRARINVLSELACEWGEALGRWSALNAGRKQEAGGVFAPDANEEVFLYQNLLGAWPLCDQDRAAFRDRIHNFLQKSLREAKVHTNWLHPNEAYENAVCAFASAILDDSSPNDFLEDFVPFQEKVAYAGAINALAQVLLKIASPGLPDFYQGTEVWDFSLVDPDNRRPVDFASRTRMLDDMRRVGPKDIPELVRELTEHWQDGRIKLYLTFKALNFRRTRSALFTGGEYVPVYAEGQARENVCAFARRAGDEWALAVTPRLIAQRLGTGALAPGIWGDAALSLPEGAPARWRNILTAEVTDVEGGKLRLSEVLGRFPVALLEPAPAS